jgi:hypothetical protein
VTAFSIQDRITGWMADQIAREDPIGGDDWGYCASLQVQQTPNGAVPLWALMLSLRGPFLRQPPICATLLLAGAGGVPQEQGVRAIVTSIMGQLRQAFEQQKASMVKAPGLGLEGLGKIPGLKGAMKQGPN